VRRPVKKADLSAGLPVPALLGGSIQDCGEGLEAGRRLRAGSDRLGRGAFPASGLSSMLSHESDFSS